MEYVLGVAIVCGIVEFLVYVSMWAPYQALCARFPMKTTDEELEAVGALHLEGASSEGLGRVRVADGVLWGRHQMPRRQYFVLRVEPGAVAGAQVRWGVPLLGTLTAFGVMYAAWLASAVMSGGALDSQQIFGHVGLLLTITVLGGAGLLVVGYAGARWGLEGLIARR